MKKTFAIWLLFTALFAAPLVSDAQTIPGGGGGGGGSPCTFANPTATSATAAVNGAATTCMRSDAAPALGTTTGSGNLVRATSPALTTPNLGTPSAATLTNATGLVPSSGLAATGTPSSSTVLFGDNTWKAASGTGTVTSVTAGNGINLSTNPCTATCTAATTVTLNTQTGTTYALASTDGGKVVSANNVSSQAYSLVVASTSGFTTGWGMNLDCLGDGTVTVTATTSIFDNGLNTLVCNEGQMASLWSDGTNYHSALSLPVMNVDTVLGNPSAVENYPLMMQLPSCSSASSALTYDTTAHVFGCNTFSGGGTVTTLTAGTNVTFSSGATCTSTCTINATGGGSSTYTVTMSGNVSGTPGAAGLGLVLATATLTDNNTSGTGTAALFTAHSIAAPTFAATNATVTATEADTLYIAGPPAAGTNETLTKAMSVVLATGDMGFKSNTSVLRFYNVGGPGVTNREEGDIGWSGNQFIISTVANGTGSARILQLLSASSITLNAASASNIQFQVAGSNQYTMSTGALAGSNGNGFTLLNAAASCTAPDIVPNKSVNTSGLGYASSNPCMVNAGTNIESWASTGPIITTIPADTASTDASLCRDTSSGAMKTGTGTLGICLGTSSARFKNNIRPLSLGLEEIMRLQPKSYHLNEDHRRISLKVIAPDKEYYGFMAEDMVKALPKLVGNDNKGRPNTADYLGVVPVLVKAMQQQQQQIEDLKKAAIVQQAQIVSLKRDIVVTQQASIKDRTKRTAVKKAGFF